MNFNLNELFCAIYNDKPLQIQTDLFGLTNSVKSDAHHYDQKDIDLLSFYFKNDTSIFENEIRKFYEMSQGGFDLLIYAWMSELPVEMQIIKYGRKLITGISNAAIDHEKQITIEKILTNRSDENLIKLTEAACKTQREIDRMLGLLRFSPDNRGIYTASCEPDHLVLPAIAEHFKSRFGNTSWYIIDEKRNIAVNCYEGKEPLVLIFTDIKEFSLSGNDEWEELWRHYHKIINNESRKNTDLQRQFMPKRYWKYLPEVK